MSVKFTIIIPTYNRAHLISRAINSLIKQTYNNWEVIIVDNYSNDNTENIIKNFQDNRLIFKKIEHTGIVARSLNLGLKLAKGEWIGFLDSDDWYALNKLETCVKNINNNVDLIHHDLKIVYNNLSFFKNKIMKGQQLTKPVINDLLLNGSRIFHSSVVVRKNLLNRIKGISEDLNLVQTYDYDTQLRIALLTDNFLYIPKKLGGFLVHDQNFEEKNVDISIKERNVQKPYINKLNQKQIKQNEARLTYKSGRFALNNSKYKEAKPKFIFSIKYGKFNIKIRSIISILQLLLKTIIKTT